jgi:hypothetical protein
MFQWLSRWSTVRKVRKSSLLVFSLYCKIDLVLSPLDSHVCSALLASSRSCKYKGLRKAAPRARLLSFSAYWRCRVLSNIKSSMLSIPDFNKNSRHFSVPAGLTGPQPLHPHDPLDDQLAMPPYEYAPLDAQRNEIRLIKLFPGAFEDVVEIMIFHSEMVDDVDRSSSDASSETTSPLSRSRTSSLNSLGHMTLEEPLLDNAVHLQSDKGTETQDLDKSNVPVQSSPVVNPSSDGTTSDSDSSPQIKKAAGRHSQVLAEASEDALDTNSLDSGSDKSDSILPDSKHSGSGSHVSENFNGGYSGEESFSDRSENYSDTSLDGNFILNDFEALSYVWGTETELHTITVRNGSPSPSSDSGEETDTREHETATSTIAVRPNLLVALRYLRDPKNVRTLWIDAVCINQQDLSERSTEVSRMGSIYHNAKRVVIWLGPEADNSELAVEACKTIGKLMDDKSLPSFIYPQKSLDNKGPQNNQQHRENVVAEQLSSEEIHAIGRLINRPWFGRLWVYQEAQQARKSTMIIGSCSVPFHPGPFMDVISWLLWANLNGHCPNSGDFEVRHLSLLSNLVMREVLRGVQSIEAAKYAQCLDDRDRVYAVLSLLPSDYTAMIRPDYSLKVIDVYKDFFLAHIGVDTKVELFWKIPLRDPSEPSWIPDLADTLRRHNFVNSSGQSRHEITYLEDSEHLSIAAVHAATINYIGVPISPDAKISEIIAACTSWELPNLTSGTYRDGNPMWNAFLTTIVGGLTREFSPLNLTMSVEELRVAYLACVRAEQPEESNSQILWWLQNILQGRAFFTTSEGYMGLCPVFAEVGDYICVALGCNSPLILHPLPGLKEFRMRGECYTHGLMRGEALLGPFPEPWKCRCSKRQRASFPYTTTMEMWSHREIRGCLRYLLGGVSYTDGTSIMYPTTSMMTTGSRWTFGSITCQRKRLLGTILD